MADPKKNVVMIPGIYEVMQRPDTMSDGSKVDILVLFENGMEKFCPLSPPLVIPAQFQGSEHKVIRPACNSRCAQFRINNAEKLGTYVDLTCGAGIRYLISEKGQEVETLKKV